MIGVEEQVEANDIANEATVHVQMHTINEHDGGDMARVEASDADIAIQATVSGVEQEIGELRIAQVKGGVQTRSNDNVPSYRKTLNKQVRCTYIAVSS